MDTRDNEIQRILTQAESKKTHEYQSVVFILSVVTFSAVIDLHSLGLLRTHPESSQSDISIKFGNCPILYICLQLKLMASHTKNTLTQVIVLTYLCIFVCLFFLVIHLFHSLSRLCTLQLDNCYLQDHKMPLSHHSSTVICPNDILTTTHCMQFYIKYSI